VSLYEFNGLGRIFAYFLVNAVVDGMRQLQCHDKEKERSAKY